MILKRLSETIFNEALLPHILDRYNAYAQRRNHEYILTSKEMKKRIAETGKGITNIVNLAVQAGTAALPSKLRELEESKREQEQALLEAERLFIIICEHIDRMNDYF